VETTKKGFSVLYVLYYTYRTLSSIVNRLERGSIMVYVHCYTHKTAPHDLVTSTSK
jgi:hypothetical protein